MSINMNEPYYIEVYNNLKECLKFYDEELQETTYNLGKHWRCIASWRGFRILGFCVYKNENEYCVHSGYDWKDDEEPNMGYYSIDLTRDELISKISEKYVELRKKNNLFKDLS